MKTYAVEVDGLPLEIVQDDDGAFIIPDGWRGIGSAVKPAFEPILLARRPLSESSIARNVLVHGTGALNIDGCRIATDWASERGEAWLRSGNNSEKMQAASYMGRNGKASGSVADRVSSLGRFPANVLHDGSEEVLALFPETGASRAGLRGEQHSGRHGGLAVFGGNIKPGTNSSRGHDDNGGSAARFFPALDYGPEDIPRGLYCPKAGKADRAGSKHPTVKPQKLMRWLCRLVTPPGGTVLDPFAGSGATLKAATSEGFHAIGCDITDEWIAEMEARFDVEAERASDVADLAAALR